MFELNEHLLLIQPDIYIYIWSHCQALIHVFKALEWFLLRSYNFTSTIHKFYYHHFYYLPTNYFSTTRSSINIGSLSILQQFLTGYVSHCSGRHEELSLPERVRRIVTSFTASSVFETNFLFSELCQSFIFKISFLKELWQLLCGIFTGWIITSPSYGFHITFFCKHYFLLLYIER